MVIQRHYLVSDLRTLARGLSALGKVNKSEGQNDQNGDEVSLNRSHCCLCCSNAVV